jgi:two-component system cell cycle response regulator
MSGKILIVDDVATNRVVLKAKLASAWYEILLACDGETALRLALREQPDIILLDAQMPGFDGFQTCARLKADPATAHIPVIMITAQADRAARMRGLGAGADDFLIKPVNDMALLARVRNLMREKSVVDELRLRAQTCRALGLEDGSGAGAHPAGPGRIQVVAADQAAARALAADLAPLSEDTIEAVTPEAALSGHAACPPDVLLLLASARPRDATLALLSELRSRPATRHAAFIVMLAEGDMAGAAAALDLGANDCTFPDTDLAELTVRLRSQMRRTRHAERLRASVQDGLRLAVLDPLTGLWNRRYALHHLDQIATRAAETGRTYALMLLDVDRFKAVNDAHGHMAGDAVLAEVARRLRDNLRGVDLLARFGGEEFIAALPDTGLEEARIAAERLRRVIGETPFAVPGKPDQVPITLSVGVALGEQGGMDVPALIEAADRALYASKTAGRNSVTFGRRAA